jgi:L-ascorbate metabolism protein UlaG (beta-lactamase superfamily)
MSVSITWLGHSAFFLDIDGHPLLFDPFLTDNPLAAASADEVDAELILLSHAHGDHLGDTVDIARRTGAKVVSNAEIAKWMTRHDVNAHAQNTGGSYNHGFVTVKQTIAFHSSSFPDGSYGGDPNGFIVTTTNGVRLYFAGDTALFSDMQLIGDERLDVAILPIGDNFTMGPDDALKAVNLLRPRIVIPMHYNTFPAITVDASGWANRVNSVTNATPVVLDPGGSYTLA